MGILSDYDNCDAILMKEMSLHFTEPDCALARFESLVLSQKPATEPWQPVTDYSFEARKAIEGPHAQLIKNVLEPASLLDVGCGPGHLLRMLAELGVLCRGIDRAARGGTPEDFIERWDIATPRESGETWVPPRWDSDVVLCREVLEHLTIRQIRQAVSNLCMLSNRLVYVTTRFAKHPISLLDVDTSDDLDPTHITMLNQDFLRVLFVLEGFKRRADLETKMDWQHKGRCLVYERA